MKTPRRLAFSLIELLIVIAVVGILATLVLPSVSSIIRGTQLTQAGDQVVALLSLARQTALTRNCPVEVRFYQFGDSSIPGESADDPSSGYYRALQTFEIDDVGQAKPLGRSEFLPSSIIMDSGSGLSTLPASLSNKAWASLDPQIKIPRVDTSYNCRAFRFLPDGSAHATGLSQTNKWYLTLHNILEGDNLSEPPANYITVQIDPVNGALKTWQP